MFLLSSLPQNLIDTIMDFDMSPSVIKLWISGDRMMQHKISTGVTKIKLIDRRLVTSGRFPKFITELRSLRYLTIDRDGYAMPYYRDIPKLIRCLPSTLKKLKILVKDSVLCIYPPTPKGTSGSSSHSLVYVASVTTLHDWTFARAFPQLETLELDFNRRDYPKHRSWDHGDFSLLPPSLTSLTIPPGPFHDIDEAFASSMPRQLQVLKIRLTPFLSASAWSQLPPHLTRLDMALDPKSFWHIGHLTSLTHLEPGFGVQNLELADLPHGLTSLDTTWFDSFDDNAHLLKNFTNLKHIKFHKPSPEQMRFVPPSVHSFRQVHHSASHGGFADLWPPSLTKLYAGSYGNDYPPSHFPSKGLVSLDLSRIIGSTTLATFPHTLRSLNLQSLSIPDNQELIFPPHLTSLTWYKGDFQLEVTDESTGVLCNLTDRELLASLNGKKAFRCFSFLKLPRSLLYLRFYSIIPASQLKHLPPRLKQLTARDIFVDVDFVPDDALEMSAMQAVFKIGADEGIWSDCESACFDWTQLKRASIATLLPRTLTGIQLDGDAFNASKPEWSMIPPHLTDFIYKPIAGIPAHFLGEIPMKRMKVLRIIVDGAEEQHLKLIPRYIHEARIQIINSPNLPITALKCIPATFLDFSLGHYLQGATNKLLELQRTHIDDDNPSYYLRLLQPDDDILNQTKQGPRPTLGPRNR